MLFAVWLAMVLVVGWLGWKSGVVSVARDSKSGRGWWCVTLPGVELYIWIPVDFIR